MKKVWLITGCSTGFGRQIALEVLSYGHSVAVTSRNTKDIMDIVAMYPDQSIALTLDVTKTDEIQNAVQKTIEKFSRIDVLVNNAGIGYFGAVEESEETEVRRMFEINVFGLANVTNAVLPYMRIQRSGHIINIASIGGYVSNPAVGFYNATKYAVVGLSEALAKETDNLGIHVTIIAPSGFRTDWAGRSANNSSKEISDYHSTAHKNKDTIRGYSGRQPGDPKRAAIAIRRIAESVNPPRHLFLGAGALRGIKNKITELQTDIENWEETTLWADNPDYKNL